MATMEYYLEHSDELARKVLDEWETSAKPTSPAFQALFDKASQYLVARRVEQKRQGDPEVARPDKVEEQAARLAFAEAYKGFDENRRAARI